MINLKINGRDVEVEDNSTILEAAKKYNIKIPTLCHYPDLHINSDCRICVVEIEGYRGLKTSCSTPVREGMSIQTNTPKVLNARKTITELILSNHDANCTACVRNMSCELQLLANNLGIDVNRFENVLEPREIDDHNPSIVRNANRCIKCGRCVDVCKNVQGMHVLDSMGRGHDMEIAPAFGKYLTDESCTFCGQCANVCPVGAIIEKDNTDQVWEKLHDPNFHVMVQIAPAVRTAIGEEIGLSSGLVSNGKLVSAMKHLGFNNVYDTNFTADLTIMEEGTELITRISTGGVLPLMTSCCPGWINLAEQEYPEILPHISSCKSPQQMFGALAKSYYATKLEKEPKDIYVVSVMPCTAKKYEAERKEFRLDNENPDVDIVLTTRELGKMFRQMGIDFDEIKEVEFDSPFGLTTGAAQLFGATGGVTEAALRTVSEVVNKKPLDNLDFHAVRGLKGIKEAEVVLGGQTVKVAVSHSLSNARTLIEQVIRGESPYTFIEIMACPGGCIGGGGQPYGTTNEVRQQRIASTYMVDGEMVYRKSHENPSIKALYKEYLKEPNSKRAHHLLHTTYFQRNT
ncbi:NADH-quinone oxidoreductase subunit G [Candidatus Izimaplasma bacterium HR1]|jgi:NADH-quinone oxidoreductase subunit G/NADP-reducing hydrogenase subunit HndD|uniref:NADH-dependent [FeFe] hydrogenase, group A6 n=1 Tax=Candidatus Izimoplasma sp. HR1 TaxID=1541959 RepID=UPI0004F704BA|nr:NADH-quinone oxidoreductase subunit G [Candidatus Izimaplasma bacterium HR1]